MDKFRVAGLFVLFMILLADPSDAWGRRRRRAKNPGWSASDGGITYTFNNGVRVTGHGGISPPNVGIRVTIPFGRRRRDVSPEEDDSTESSEIDDDDDVEDEPKPCSGCLDVKRLVGSDNELTSLVNETQSDLVMVASYDVENFSKKKLKAEMTFTITDVYKTPREDISVGDTFKIDASLSRCACLKYIESGLYVITGKLDVRGNLVVSGNLIKMPSM